MLHHHKLQCPVVLVYFLVPCKNSALKKKKNWGWGVGGVVLLPEMGFEPRVCTVVQSLTVWENGRAFTQAWSLTITNNNNVHLSCAHQRPERSHNTY